MSRADRRAEQHHTYRRRALVAQAREHRRAEAAEVAVRVTHADVDAFNRTRAVHRWSRRVALAAMAASLAYVLVSLALHVP